jgi:hypothetical protein
MLSRELPGKGAIFVRGTGGNRRILLLGRTCRPELICVTPLMTAHLRYYQAPCLFYHTDGTRGHCRLGSGQAMSLVCSLHRRMLSS